MENILPKKLASSSYLNPSLGFTPYNPEQSSESRPFITAIINGQKQIIPTLTNQTINRRIFKPLLSPEDTIIPKNQEKTVLPYLIARESLQKEATSATPSMAEVTPLVVPFIPTQPPPLTSDSFAKDIIQSLVSEKPGTESKEPQGLALNSYKTQIQNLLTQSQTLDQQINLSQEELKRLKVSLTKLQETAAVSSPDSEKKTAELSQAASLIDKELLLLNQKVEEKKKLLDDFLAASQEDLTLFAETDTNQKTSQALINNLKIALSNAQKEAADFRQKGTPTADLQAKTTTVLEMEKTLRQKEEEVKKMQSAVTLALQKNQQAESLKQEIERYQKETSLLNERKNALAGQVVNNETENQKLKETLALSEKENQQKAEKMQSLEKNLQQLSLEKEKTSRFAQELAEKLVEIKNRARLEQVVFEAPSTPTPSPKADIKIIKLDKNFKSSISPFTKLPNALNGVIKDSKGQLLSNAVVIIKDLSNHSIRALNTNALGQFLVTSPLSNAIYRIETAKLGLSFDIIEIELFGQVILPIEIISH
ncbi:MAG: hypothetical protein UT63_C0082G0005 [Candidatus Gottesmanbacteria bacterium GW2011_GWC2_39_8]|uniref:Carboxypeptidase regulatory-like domain-containing protein n=1 Tax=Candidatus Gottesmanbacteria bacterium GW2011_GWC2_39_8 TaxID=1618450 RepID=A0A0G0S8R9_9BACT|nr:MAG: hypothetical protein UT63_C0082G0005 [Candidatus Gottesmanbacteria bacterium GW2011_GWC2_39_8]